MRKPTTVAHDDFAVSWTTGGSRGGARLSVRRVRWTTDEELARRVGLYICARYRDAETGELVMSEEDLSQPESSVAEHSFMTPADHDGRWFPSLEEAQDFALTRGYTRVWHGSEELRRRRLARASQQCPRCGSRDVSCFARAEHREDYADLTECQECGLRGKGPDWRERGPSRVIDLGGPMGGRFWRVVTEHPTTHPDAHSAAVHARVTGSVGCTYNDARVVRA